MFWQPDSTESSACSEHAFRLHRDLLQSEKASFQPRIPLSRGVRTSPLEGANSSGLKPKKENPIFSFRKNNKNQNSERAVNVKGANEINSRGPRASVGRMLFMSACDLTATKLLSLKPSPQLTQFTCPSFRAQIRMRMASGRDRILPSDHGRSGLNGKGAQ